MSGLLALLVLSVLASVQGQSSLQDIQNKIQQSGRLNAQSLGPKLAGFLGSALQSSDISLLNFSFHLTANELQILCDANIWSSKLHAEIDIYDKSGDFELAFQFTVAAPIDQVYEFLSGNKTIPEVLKDFSGSSTWQVSFASADGLPFTKGITVSGTADVVKGTLIKTLQRFQPSLTDLHVTASLYVPIFSANPEDIALTLTYNGDLHVSSWMVLQQFSLTVDVPSNFQVGGTLQVTLKDGDVLSFQMSGQFSGQPAQIQLQGKMTGPWQHPLGIKWLTVNSATGSLSLGNDNTQSLALSAIGTVGFSTKPITLTFSMGGPGFQNILIAAENIDVSKRVAEIYSDITGKSSQTLAQLNITGTADMAISTYSTGKYQEGFTLSVDAIVDSGGSLMKATRILKSDATPSTFTYVATLYIPIFSQAAADVSLVETGAFAITKSISCQDYSFEVDLSSEVSIIINADIQIAGKLSNGGPLKFAVSATYQNGEADFKGTLENPWTQPFGLSWVVINTGYVEFTLGGPEDIQLVFSGSAQFAFDLNGPVQITMSIGGPDLEDALLSVKGLPLDSTTVDLICYYLLGMTQPPAVIKSLHPTGTAEISIATYDSSDAREGFTFTADVTLIDQGDLYKIAKFFNSDPSTITFQLSLYVSVFSNPEMEFSITENGHFPVKPGVNVDSYSIDVVVAAEPSIKVAAEVAVQFKKDSTPMVFDASADWEAASASLTLTGSMSGAWIHPFGAKWLQINNVAINLVLSATVGMQSLTVSGAGNFTFGVNSGTASVSVSLTNTLEATLSATLTDQWTLAQVAESIIGLPAPAYVKDVQKSSGDVSLTIVLDTGSGVTLDVSGTVTGDLQKEVRHVMYWFTSSDPGTLTFDVHLGLPIFSTNPTAIDIALSLSDEIQISKHLWFESVTFSLNAAPPVSVALDGRIKAEFQKNPVLYFEASGQFSGDGSVLLWGAMEGTWQNPFGIKGFSLSDVILEFGINPANCGVDACISDLGLGVGMTIGHTQIKFDGNAAAPDWWNVFLSGSISSTSPSKALAVTDVIDTWNSANPSEPVSKSGIPSDWALNGCSFYFAPVDGQFGPIHYTAGFGIAASMTLLSMDVNVGLNCTDSAGFSCNFAFDVHVTVNQFTTMIKKELGLMYPNRTDFDIFSVKDVRLAEWSQQNVAGGTQPRWLIDMTVLNSDKKLDFRVQQYELSSSFHSFFVAYLKHLFG